MEFAKSIEAEELSKLPLTKFEGPVTVISDLDSFNRIVPELQQYKCFGFDTETKPAFKKGVVNQVALLQLATENESYLFRLNKIGLPNELMALLSNKEIIKVGAAIHDDIKSLTSLRHHKPNGFVDLQSLAKDLGFNSFSLKKLSAIVLGYRISKSQQLSNWEADELTRKQVIYAATDAWISLQVYLGIKNNHH